MKKIFYFLLAIIAVSCSETSTDNVSKVTNYPLLTFNGDETMFVPLGSDFTDPGIIATEGGNTIPYTTVVGAGKYKGEKNINTDVVDEYSITYSAKNKDDFSGSITRKVIVYKTGDLVNSIEGVYISTVTRNGSLLNPAQGSSEDMEYVYIWKNTDNTYEVSDAFGGWYDIGRDFGAVGATPGGTISGDIPSNNFTFPGNPLANSNFGGTANITALNVNPTTKVITLNCTWITEDDPPSTYSFISTLEQVQP
ncbi:MAG TPA: immunoglobulin-like domain-containing protein [Flavobacterium sp.]|uniref:immunoglobulin-like domain-containing protein n=1 Tax=Flavobacterium sp. TaxID=239 RepID=UPI002DBED37B|nr:immunoglobulin-like domain-containing protein [Flavobacterium sp.]HEU4788362.1 immunoglobulin-like domain-containing protein [Flavobacterium sp.]